MVVYLQFDKMIVDFVNVDFPFFAELLSNVAVDDRIAKKSENGSLGNWFNNNQMVLCERYNVNMDNTEYSLSYLSENSARFSLPKMNNL